MTVTWSIDGIEMSGLEGPTPSLEKGAVETLTLVENGDGSNYRTLRNRLQYAEESIRYGANDSDVPWFRENLPDRAPVDSQLVYVEPTGTDIIDAQPFWALITGGGDSTKPVSDTSLRKLDLELFVLADGDEYAHKKGVRSDLESTRHGIDFGDTDGYVNIPRDSELVFEGDMSLACWYKYRKFLGSQDRYNLVQTSPDDDFYFQIWSDGGRYRYFHGDDSGNRENFTFDLSPSVETGVRHLGGFSRDDANSEVSAYHDGEFLGSATYNNPVTGDPSVNIYVSRHGRTFSGIISDVIIWDRTLTDAEWRDLYRDEIPDNPVIHWPLDEGEGDTVESSEGTYPGDIHGSAEWVVYHE